MKISHLNIRSIFTGFNDFKDIVLDNSFDIVLLTETWLNQDTNANFSIPEYVFFHKDRLGRALTNH